jgi:hypothetical protein
LSYVYSDNNQPNHWPQYWTQQQELQQQAEESQYLIAWVLVSIGAELELNPYAIAD